MSDYRLREKGYNDAIDAAKVKLAQTKPEVIENNTNAKWNGKFYEMPWFNTVINIEESTVIEKVLQYLYITRNGSKNIGKNLISFLQIPSGALKNEDFIQQSVTPMVKAFANDLDTFAKVCEKLGGVKQRFGHASYTLYPLPYVPLTYIIWQGDDEIADSGSILFDETVVEWYNPEEAEALAIITTQILLETKSKYFS